MGRIEENKELLNQIALSAEANPNGKYETMVIWHLGVISSFLGDISKSLAILAAEKKGRNDE